MNDLSSTEISKCVNAGVAFLNVVFRKDWASKIDLSTFNPHAFDKCVIGQTFGCSYASEFFIVMEDHDIDPVEHGFMLDSYFNIEDNESLKQEWIKVIKELQTA